MSRFSKISFFRGVSGSSGILFRTGNKPTQFTYQKLFDSIPFIVDSADTAKTTEAGHTMVATAAEGYARTSSFADSHNRCVTPVMLPDVMIDYTGNTLQATETKNGLIVYTVEGTSTGEKNFALGLNLDSNILEIDTDELSVKDGGIDTTQLADDSVSLAKMDAMTGQGYIITSGAAGAPQYLLAKTSGTFLGGDGTDIVMQTMGGDATLDGSGNLSLANDCIDLAELAQQTRGDLLTWDSSNDPSVLNIGAANTILYSDGNDLAYTAVGGDITHAAGTFTIANNAVTLAKMDDFTGQGYIIVGGAAGAPAYVDFSTNTYMGIGDGTTFNSVQITGDISITNAGVVSITAGSIVDADINAAAAISLTKIESLVSKVSENYLTQSTSGKIYYGPLCQKILGGADFKALLDGTTQTLFASNEDDYIVDVAICIQAVSTGACAATIGGDANVCGVADTDAFLTSLDLVAAGTGKYEASDITYCGVDIQGSGGHVTNADGNVTITTTADITADATFAGWAFMKYLPK